LRHRLINTKTFVSAAIIFVLAAFAFGTAATGAQDWEGGSARDERDIREVRRLAEQVVENLHRPYAGVAAVVSPARLPDRTDYLLDKPLDVDISFVFDTFKQNYCDAAPAGYSARVKDFGGVEFTDSDRTVKKEGVPLPAGPVREAVRRVAENFRRVEPGIYDYSVGISRRAHIEVEAGLVRISEKVPKEIPCNPGAGSVFLLDFAKHSGTWRLYDIERVDSIECENRYGTQSPPGMDPTPYYENCAMPED